MKHARRHAREVALQALYAWQLSGGDPLEEARSNEDYEKTEFLEDLVRGVAGRAAELERLIAPHLDRDFARHFPASSRFCRKSSPGPSIPCTASRPSAGSRNAHGC